VDGDEFVMHVLACFDLDIIRFLNQTLHMNVHLGDFFRNNCRHRAKIRRHRAKAELVELTSLVDVRVCPYLPETLFVLELHCTHLIIHGKNVSKQQQRNNSVREISPSGGQGISMSKKIPPPLFSSLGLLP
jgi:hypothetical protein